MTQYDLAAVAALLAFGYSGYRRGLIVFVLQAAGSVLAFALAAVLAPALVPSLASAIDLPEMALRPLAVAALTLALRVLFGFALRELAAVVRALLDAVPPVAAIDRMLGIVPGLALGALVVLAVSLALLTLHAAGPLHTAVTESWLARHVLTQPEAVLATVRRLWDELVAVPPHSATAPVVAGVGGLWMSALVVWRWRGTAAQRPERVPTRRALRAPETTALMADPLAGPRAALGVLTAVGVMALLVVLARLRA